MKQKTLSIVKPDAVEKNVIGNILSQFEKNGFKIVAAKMIHLSLAKAEQFYSVHKTRPFFSTLTQFMSSGPCFVFVLEGDNAVEKTRALMGNTDSTKAERGTIRNLFGTDIEKNAIHGSDSLENAGKEIAFFFSPNEIFSR